MNGATYSFRSDSVFFSTAVRAQNVVCRLFTVMRGSSKYLQELRELTNLDGAACLVRRDELELGRTPASLAELKAKRPKNRIDALLTKVRVLV